MPPLRVQALAQALVSRADTRARKAPHRAGKARLSPVYGGDRERLQFRPKPKLVSTRDSASDDDPTRGCEVHQVRQELGTCWIAAVVFVLKNVKSLWDLMNRTVQDFVEQYYSDAGRALGVSAYDLRDPTADCRALPSEITRWMWEGNEHDVDCPRGRYKYVDAESGGDQNAMLYACLRASDVACRFFAPQAYAELMDASPHDVWVWVTQLNFKNQGRQPRVFGTHLLEIARRAHNVYSGFSCVGGLLSVGYPEYHDEDLTDYAASDHVLGFVACDDRDGDFLLCQGYDSERENNCERFSRLADGRTYLLQYDAERTRARKKLQTDRIDLVYVSDSSRGGQRVERARMAELCRYLEESFGDCGAE